MMLVPWLTYLAGESLGFSGIVSIMFCGIPIVKYGLPNITSWGRKVTKSFYKVIAHNLEALTFNLIGIGIFGFDLPYKSLGGFFIFGAFISLSIARAANVALCSWIINKFSTGKLTRSQQIVLWFSGFRGAMGTPIVFAFPIKTSFGSTGSIVTWSHSGIVLQ